MATAVPAATKKQEGVKKPPGGGCWHEGEHVYQRLLLVVQGLKKLLVVEHFVSLLRAKGLDTLPKHLAERISNFEGARS